MVVVVGGSLSGNFVGGSLSGNFVVVVVSQGRGRCYGESPPRPEPVGRCVEILVRGDREILLLLLLSWWLGVVGFCRTHSLMQ